ncbi:MAG TPA: hypothetical protein VN026_15645 [Bacteroidia bacterium]|jgi:hypothetical protein|nr:hypothetical protein [Bacteroidia bacterium]
MLRAINLVILFCFAFLFQTIRAQDLIYLNNGSKVEAIVKEISTSEIKYKNFTNPDGPTYIVAKGDVLFIEYKNGVVEVLNPNPTSISPIKTVTTTPKREIVKKGPYDLYYLNKNCLYFNGIALANSDIALLYDREFAKNRFSLTVLGAYNFNLHTNYTNRYIQALGISKKNYDIGIGVNYYTQARKRSQYFVGLMFKYMNYDYVRETEVHDVINGLPFTNIKKENVNNFQFASMIVNGIQIRATPFFTYRIFIGLGFTNKDSDISKAVKADPAQQPRSFGKAYLGMCVGYRFY